MTRKNKINICIYKNDSWTNINHLLFICVCEFREWVSSSVSHRSQNGQNYIIIACDHNWLNNCVTSFEMANEWAFCAIMGMTLWRGAIQEVWFRSRWWNRETFTTIVIMRIREVTDQLHFPPILYTIIWSWEFWISSIHSNQHDKTIGILCTTN